MIVNGLILTVLGMGVVFIFIIVMINVMNLVAWIARKFFPEQEEEQVPAAASGAGSDAEVAAAVAVAYSKKG